MRVCLHANTMNVGLDESVDNCDNVDNSSVEVSWLELALGPSDRKDEASTFSATVTTVTSTDNDGGNSSSSSRKIVNSIASTVYDSMKELKKKRIKKKKRSAIEPLVNNDDNSNGDSSDKHEVDRNEKRRRSKKSNAYIWNYPSFISTAVTNMHYYLALVSVGLSRIPLNHASFYTTNKLACLSCIALLLCFVVDVLPYNTHSQYWCRYNQFFLLSIVAFRTTEQSDAKAIGTPLFYIFSIAASFVVDIIASSTMMSKKHQLLGIVMLAGVMSVKVYAAIDILSYYSTARKLLIRRLRLFLPYRWICSSNPPKRIMREIRSRMLAINIINFTGSILYLTSFFLCITHYKYANHRVFNYPALGVPLPVFFLVKSLVSAAMFMLILYDTDIVLFLFHFGLTGFYFDMGRVKSYIIRRKKELKGWPYTYAFNTKRFKVLSFVKIFIDFVWGLLGWVTIGSVGSLSAIEHDTKSLLVAMVFMLTWTDLLGTMLYLSIYKLLSMHKSNTRGQGSSAASDDSELDDFHIRGCNKDDNSNDVTMPAHMTIQD